MGKIHRLQNIQMVEYLCDKVLQEVAELYLEERQQGNHMKAGFVHAMLNSFTTQIEMIMGCDHLNEIIPQSIEHLEGLLEKIENTRQTTEKDMFIDFHNKLAERVFKHENFQKAFYTLYNVAKKNQDITVEEMTIYAIQQGFDDVEAQFLLQHIACELGYMESISPEELYEITYNKAKGDEEE